jgi:hypothetical protein
MGLVPTGSEAASVACGGKLFMILGTPRMILAQFMNGHHIDSLVV